MVRTVNLLTGLISAVLGVWIVFNLGPLLLDSAALKAVLVELPRKYLGMPPALKITLFAGFLSLGVAACIWAGLNLSRLSSTVMKRINQILIVQLVIAFAAAEALARVGVALELRGFSNLTYFVNPACGDSYYRLVRPMPDAVSSKVYDSVLGWKPAPHADNPSGLKWPVVVDDRPKAWFFGDSFTEGVVAPEESIPAQFEALRPGRQTMNFGVGGYGVDQIWLRYKAESVRIPSGTPVYIGLLTSDLDRSVLPYFFGFKPMFNQDHDGYKLVPPPAREDIEKLASIPPEPIFSYAFASLGAVAELISTRFDRSETSCNMAEKKAVNAYLMNAIIRQAKAQNHELRWILFVSFASFYKPVNWRYAFVKEILDKNQQAYLDTKDALHRAAMAAKSTPESFFIPNDGHLNAAGNQIVANALAELTSVRVKPAK